MQKIQILFPDPLMRRVRELAEQEDRPLSEVIRRAVERFAEQSPVVDRPKSSLPKLPTFKGGRVLTDAEEMKQVLYASHE
jgi:predicted transcriptional regulator